MATQECILSMSSVSSSPLLNLALIIPRSNCPFAFPQAVRLSTSTTSKPFWDISHCNIIIIMTICAIVVHWLTSLFFFYRDSILEVYNKNHLSLLHHLLCFSVYFLVIYPRPFLQVHLTIRCSFVPFVLKLLIRLPPTALRAFLPLLRAVDSLHSHKMALPSLWHGQGRNP